MPAASQIGVAVSIPFAKMAPRLKIKEDARMSNPYAEYETAIAEIRRCTENATGLYTVVRDAANLLRDWKTASVTGVPGAAAPPGVATVSPTLTISGATWPTAAQIGRTLADWHFSKQRLRAAYERIPQHLRGQVRPPEQYL
jgi:hypothetical protein